MTHISLGVFHSTVGAVPFPPFLLFAPSAEKGPSSRHLSGRSSFEFIFKGGRFGHTTSGHPEFGSRLRCPSTTTGPPTAVLRRRLCLFALFLYRVPESSRTAFLSRVRSFFSLFMLRCVRVCVPRFVFGRFFWCFISGRN